MKILIENSSYHLMNMGDLAMLKIAVQRVKKLFPDSEIFIFTTNNSALQSHIGEVYPLDPKGKYIWLSPISEKLCYSKISMIQKFSCNLDNQLLYRLPRIRNQLTFRKLAMEPSNLHCAQEMIKMISDSDLVISTGGGYITDSFMKYTNSKLDLLAYASNIGKPTALLGQGIGPLRNEGNFKKAQKNLRCIDLITLREKKCGLPLLKSMGVNSRRIKVTGDDAIELAYNCAKKQIGNNIGINIRSASYSNINTESIELISMVLQSFAREKGADLLPVPIEHVSSSSSTEPDSKSINKILKGFNESSDGGERLQTPELVIEQISRCRMVVTGSYHAGVFALSQGISVLGLTRSQYYSDKFLGLSNQFGTGCEIVSLDDTDFESNFKKALENTWGKADEIRSNLLKSAYEQVKLSQEAYKSLPHLVS